MLFDRDDFVNFCFKNENVFFFQEELRVKSRIYSGNSGYYYYLLDLEKIKGRKDVCLAFGYIREDYIFPLSYFPSSDELLEMMLGENEQKRKEAERVYQKSKYKKQNPAFYLD